MNGPTLTIYIPTFERPELAALLASLVPQIDDSLTVVVSDNSPGRYAEPLCDPYPEVRYSPRHYNIGGDPNVLRGAAVANTDYLWVVGDDDWLLPGAVAAVSEGLHGWPDRVVLTTPDVTLAPFRGPVCEWIRTLGTDMSVLIAATLITANVWRTEIADVALGVQKMDTHYPLSWAMIGAATVAVLPRPTFQVGIEHQQRMPEAPIVWQDYLDGLAAAQDVDRIPLTACTRWNFCSAAA